MRTLVYLLLLLLIFGARATPISRILWADDEVHPDVKASVAVITNKKGNSCTATVLNERWLLTVAHCNFPKRSKVRIDTLKNEGGEQRTVRKFLKHPGYDADSGLHDIALVKLNRPFYRFDPDTPYDHKYRYKPVRLYFGKRYLKKYRAIAAGYGLSEGTSDELNQKDLKIISLKKCKNDLDRNDYLVPPDWSKRNFVCAGKNSVTCFGDSGGPLFANTTSGLVQVGVLLGGGECRDEESGEISPEKGVPNVYTSVSGHAEWIIRSVTGSILVHGKVRK